MGNQTVNCNQVLAQSMIKAEWSLQNQQGIFLVTNNFSGDQLQVKQKRTASQDIRLYVLREKYSFAHTPKVVMYEHRTQLIILIEYAPKKIQNNLQKRSLSEFQLLNEMKQVLKALQLLVRKHGCFYVSEAMLRLTKNNNVLVWFHQDFSKNNPQFPLPNGQGQQPMVSKVLKVYEKYLSETNRISPCSTFTQANGKIQQKLVTIRNQMIFQTPRKSQLQVNQLNSTRCYTNEISPGQMSFLYSSNQYVNENKSLQTRSLANNKSESFTRIIPIMHQTHQYPANHHTQNIRPVHCQNKISIGHFQKPINPQQNIKNTAKLIEYQSSRRQTVTHRPNAAPISHNQNYIQRSSMDSQYSKIFKQNNFQPQAINTMPFNIRKTNQSNVLSQYPLFSDLHLICLQPSQETPVIDFMIDSPTSFCKKPSYSMQQSAQKNVEFPSPILNLSPKVSLRVPASEMGQQQLSSADFNISHSHISDQLNKDFNGLFGSNRSIQNDSQIESPLKRQINNDLRKLFF